MRRVSCSQKPWIVIRNAVAMLFAVAAGLLLGAGPVPCAAQTASESNVHHLLNHETPPGLIGQTRLARGGPVHGYPQPVEIRGPEGVHVSFGGQGQFLAPEPLPARAGLLIGSVYRFRLSHIPLHEGKSVFPTVEVIDRLYPPPGQETRFPIVVEITMDDILLAMGGKYVTRVVYVEPPQNAMPLRGDVGGQAWIEVQSDRDPLAVADTLGRPVAIVRLGGRVPMADDGALDSNFLFGCPPLMVIRNPGDGSAAERPNGGAPRVVARPREGRTERPADATAAVSNPNFRRRRDFGLEKTANTKTSPWIRPTY